MGVDPLTIGIGATLVGGGLKAIGASRERKRQQNTIDQRTQGVQGLMRTGTDPYQSAIMQLLGGIARPGEIDPNSGAIDIQNFLGQQNVGQDALMQFLRSDPSKQTPFDASKAFDMLQANDQRLQSNAVNQLAQTFSGSIGQRFGTAARRSTSDLLANLAGQFGARNAGIAQSSYENAANRSMQGLGLQLQAAQGLNQNTGILAQLLMANQGNQRANQALNLQGQGQYFGEQLQGLGAAAGLRNQTDQYNAMLQQLIAGMPMVQGSGWSDLGGLVGQAGQGYSFLPMLRGMGAPSPTMTGGGYGGFSIPQLQLPGILQPGAPLVDPRIYGGLQIPGAMY